MAGEGSHLQLASCSSAGSRAACFRAQHDAHLVLRDCNSSCAAHDACAAESSAHLTGNNVTVQQSGGHGLSVVGGSSAHLHACSFSTSQGSALYVSGKMTTAQISACVMASNACHGITVCDCASGTAKRCTFSENGGSGVFVEDQGILTMEACNSDGNKERGFWAQDRGRLTLLQCSSTSDGWQGCGARSGGYVSACDVALRNCGQSGLMFENAVGVLKRCSCTGAGGRGVNVEGLHASVQMAGGRVSENCQGGVYVSGGADARVDDVIAVGNNAFGFLCDGGHERARSKLALMNCEYESEREGSEYVEVSHWVRRILAGASNRAFVAQRRGVVAAHGCRVVGGRQWHVELEMFQWWAALLWQRTS